MNESSLHLSLKQFYTQDGGLEEVWVNGYMIDVVKDELLIEIQTGSFNALRTKLEDLLNDYKVRVVYPIAHEKFLILQDSHSVQLKRRRSPKKGRIEDLFNQLIYITNVLCHHNFSVEVVLTSEEEFRINDGLGSWRRGGVSIIDRRLLSILNRVVFIQKSDFLKLIPADLDGDFTNLDLAKRLSISRPLASKMTYCLTKLGVLSRCGKRARFTLFQKSVQ